MSALIAVTVASFVVVGLILLVLVLAQKGRGAGTFLGGGSGHTVLGTKATEVITWVTASTFALFLLLAVLLNRMLG